MSPFVFAPFTFDFFNYIILNPKYTHKLGELINNVIVFDEECRKLALKYEKRKK